MISYVSANGCFAAILSSLCGTVIVVVAVVVVIVVLRVKRRRILVDKKAGCICKGKIKY